LVQVPPYDAPSFQSLMWFRATCMKGIFVTKDSKILYEAKLRSSDLTVKDAKKLGFTIIEDPQSLENHFFPVPAFKIPYYDLSGKPTGFYRIRYLEGTKKGFSRATTTKDRRYDQPAAEIPQLYLPQLLSGGRSWKQLCDDKQRFPIVFTEGELKAACATKHGIPTIALGGVWNFKSKRNGLFRLPMLGEDIFKGREVFIVFDSDAVTNPQVLHAQYKFALELFQIGAIPRIVNIPWAGERKFGIDDYIVEYGAAKFTGLLKNTDNHIEFSFCKELLKINSEIALVRTPIAIVDFETGNLLTKSDATLLFADRKMMKQKMAPAAVEGGKGTIKHVEVPVFDEWTQWEQRTEVWSPVYEPGKEQLVWLEGRRHYNTWKGWGSVPEKGDTSLWTWLLNNIFKNAEPAHRKWFEQWCAYPLQHPGTKLFTCPILFGQLKGTGKSLLGLSLISIYGINGAEITDAQLEDERNVFAAEKQFVLANEVTGSDKRAMVGRLRNLITQHTVVINKKYQPDYTVRDTINYFFTSNHVDAVYMEDDERRFFVHEVLGPRLVDLDKPKVVAYDKWLKSGECAKALFYYLLNIDLTGFDPTAPAPDTMAKAAMVEASRSEIESWCFKLREDPDTCLRSANNVIYKFSLYRLKDLVEIFAGDNSKKPYEKTMINALRKAGFNKIGNGNSCTTKDGKVNLWAIRDVSQSKLSAKEGGILYDKERDFENKPKKFAKEKK